MPSMGTQKAGSGVLLMITNALKFGVTRGGHRVEPSACEHLRRLAIGRKCGSTLRGVASGPPGQPRTWINRRGRCPERDRAKSLECSPSANEHKGTSQEDPEPRARTRRPHPKVVAFPECTREV